MTDSSGADAWGQAWLDAQRKYFDTWVDLSRQGQAAMGKGFQREAPANPFLSGVEQWFKMISPALPQENRDLSQRLLDMNKGFIQTGEQMWNLAQGMQQAMRAGQDWQQNAQEQLKAWQKQWTSGQQGATAGWNTLWGLPLQHFRQLSSSFSMFPGDVEKTLRGGGPLGASTLQHALQGALSTPAVGYTREMQEDWQEWASLWLEHAQALQKYEQLLMGVGNRTVEKMGAQILGLVKEGKGIESMRQAYDLWIDCAEDAYGALAQSSEFMETQAKLTNTLMAVKRQEQQMVEQALAVYDLPTRTEMDTAHERIHQLRRELRKLRHALEECGIENLHEKIDQIRSEMRGPVTTMPAAGQPKGKAKSTPSTKEA